MAPIAFGREIGVTLTDRAPVDVIVPVYNGREAVAACLDSVISHTPGDDVRIVVADDASPDSDIAPLLEEMAQRDSRIVIQRRSHNLGFPANCNAAMERSDRDVVLLNSDTIVPPGWLDRLRSLAATSTRIGSITPLTSNGEICSVPTWLRENEYTGDISPVQLDQVAAATGCGDWIEIPTGVGFCLYLTRRGLDEVGLFDAEEFGRGYAEENDLCLRLRNAGYLNLLCDTVFVQHAGGGSFGEEKSERVAENLGKLNERWPGYSEMIRSFIADKPLAGVQARFGMDLVRRNRSDARRVLYVLHHPLWSGHVGGTQYHVEDLVDELGDAVDALVLSLHDGLPWFQWPGRTHGEGFPAVAPGVGDLRWVDAILGLGIDVIHIHHTMNLPLDAMEALVEGAALLDIPVVYSLHDYFPICPGVQLLDAETRAPCVSLAGEDQCIGCEHEAAMTINGDVRSWRARHGAVLAGSTLVAPSAAAAAVYERQWPDLAVAVRVVPHGLHRPPMPPLRAEPAQPIRLGVVGYGGAHKGDEWLAELVTEMTDGAVEWHFFGRTWLPGLKSESAVFHGRYARDVIISLLGDSALDMVIATPTWDETYSFTLSEAWAAGVPVLAPDRGAVGERIRATGGGDILPGESPQAMAARIREVIGDSELMAELRVRARAAGEALPTVASMAMQYDELYSALAAGVRAANDHLVYPWSGEERGRLVGSFESPLPALETAPQER